MGQTRVDLLHLLEDLRDAYPGSLEFLAAWGDALGRDKRRRQNRRGRLRRRRIG